MASEVLASVLGISAYSTLAAQTRLAKDADQAPLASEKIAMARMSGQAWERFTKIARRAEAAGVDLEAAITPFRGLLDDLDARTRPTTWWERLTKTYVGVGIFTDAMRALATAAGEVEFAADVNDFGHGQWTVERLAELTAADEQLQDRLSLWTRRVGGDVLALVRSFFFTHPEMLGDADADEIFAQISKAHDERLTALHLVY
ncbi:ferritin-like fold-containing protein [Gleimia coleocanis]|nr:ferritin-like fold-containing protein [Gleimia coleocanis]